eukprot:scaffold7066_cov253-Pinguiococcus_pyrenoidosus.AAC.45
MGEESRELRMEISSTLTATQRALLAVVRGLYGSTCNAPNTESPRTTFVESEWVKYAVASLLTSCVPCQVGCGGGVHLRRRGGGFRGERLPRHTCREALHDMKSSLEGACEPAFAQSLDFSEL